MTAEEQEQHILYTNVLEYEQDHVSLSKLLKDNVEYFLPFVYSLVPKSKEICFFRIGPNSGKLTWGRILTMCRWCQVWWHTCSGNCAQWTFYCILKSCLSARECLCCIIWVRIALLLNRRIPVNDLFIQKSVCMWAHFFKWCSQTT